MANTIDEVISELSRIVDSSVTHSSPLGFFAALYRGVTIRVKEGIQQGRFQNGAQMEKLDVQFANRYLDAYSLFQNGKQPSASWLMAFRAASQWRPVIMQHLLLGMNAHINLDLGIAAQQTCPGQKLPALKSDFDMINQILAEQVQPVQQQLQKVSPWISLLDKVNRRTDDAVVNFSLTMARHAAWQFALKLNPVNASAQMKLIDEKDREIAALANKVASPRGWLLNAGLLAIRLREKQDVASVINALR